MGVGDLTEDTPQPDLFACLPAPGDARLDAALDRIRERFGSDAVQRAGLLPRKP